LGTWFAAIYGILGLIATCWGGQLASRYAAGNERLQLRAIAVMYGVFGLISPGIYLSPTFGLAIALVALLTLGIFPVIGPLFAVIQMIVPARMRAMSVALIFLFANLIGMGLGPLAVGALSEVLQRWAGNESLRYALMALSPGYFWCAWHLWRASRTVARDIEAAHLDAGAEARAEEGAASHAEALRI
jgi:MFS family permease